MPRPKATNIDEYISWFPKETQKYMQQIRKTVHAAIPKAEETISYAIPCFTQNGRYVVYFAGFKSHIGLYPLPKGNAELTKTLAKYKTGKGSVQFPLDEPMPLSLITKIVKLRLKENLAYEKAKTKK